VKNLLTRKHFKHPPLSLNLLWAGLPFTCAISGGLFYLCIDWSPLHSFITDISNIPGPNTFLSRQLATFLLVGITLPPLLLHVKLLCISYEYRKAIADPNHCPLCGYAKVNGGGKPCTECGFVWPEL
jgi:hypothetical protein